MTNKIRAYAAKQQGGRFELFEYDAGELAAEQVEIAVTHCGICHSDLSMLNNDWQMTAYPLVPGHEVVGNVAAVGREVKNIRVGQKVGLGWYSQSCMTCRQCLSGNHNLCPTVEQTIIGRHGGFAERVRCHWGWATQLPEGVDATKAGPMFCGGVTVFNPIVQFGVRPIDRVGVVGIGGLGHLALSVLEQVGLRCHGFHVERFENRGS